MVLESTMVCVDNSEFMRNGDFLPTRLQAQQDAVSLICHSKTRSNPENNVGLLTLSTSPQVLTTLTTDVGRILAKLHQVQPTGELNLLTGMRVAHLALKHRQGKNHKMRIVVFVGSPIALDEKELVKVAKRLKKEKVNVDIINFGQEADNTEKLTVFINTLNGREGSGSHLVTVPPGPHLSEALISSPVIQGEDGTGAIGLGGGGFEFGIDPNEDPELALALRVSMEEQRQRQDAEARRAQGSANPIPGAPSSGATTPTVLPTGSADTEEALLERALAMSLESGRKAAASPKPSGEPDFATMTDDERIAYAVQMSLQEGNAKASTSKGTSSPNKPDSPTPMETDSDDLQSVLQNLPGVDPSAVKQQPTGPSSSSGEKTKKEEDKDKKDAPKKDDKKDDKKDKPGKKP